ncbi:MAG: FkbM family methyltransferase [Phycisphaerales bacterium]|nr:FkbM family methyltransferase [Phycisphaerales bacterium]
MTTWILIALCVAVVVLFMLQHRLRAKVYELRNSRHQVSQALLGNARASRQAEIRRDLASRGETARLPVEFRAQQGEDLFLWSLFEGQERGTFIECGAFDGERFSVTYIFEAAGWGGVLIEALPEPFKNCQAKRTGSRVVNAALSRKGSSGTAEFLALNHAGIGHSMSRLAESSLSSAKSMKRAVKVTVPLTTMDEVLGQAGPRIDFAVLDVEGSELALLDGFDLERHGVRALLIEEHTAGKDSELRRHMEGRGYEFVSRIGRNDLFVTRKDQALIDRARQLSLLF